jgi:hypothetical protein
MNVPELGFSFISGLQSCRPLESITKVFGFLKIFTNGGLGLNWSHYDIIFRVILIFDLFANISSEEEPISFIYGNKIDDIFILFVVILSNNSGTCIDETTIW